MQQMKKTEIFFVTLWCEIIVPLMVERQFRCVMSLHFFLYFTHMKLKAIMAPIIVIRIIWCCQKSEKSEKDNQ